MDESDVTTEAPPTPAPGCAPLSALERQALILAARFALLDCRQTVAARLQRGELISSIESDLGPLVTERLKPVHAVLFELAPGQAITAAASLAWALCFEAVRGDVNGLRQLLAVSQRQTPPADAPERP